MLKSVKFLTKLLPKFGDLFFGSWLLVTQKEEAVRMSEHISDLTAQCRKHEENWTMVGDCLTEIEKESSLSELSSDALQWARQCVQDSLDLQSRVFKLHNIGAWLHTSDFQSTVGEIMCLCLMFKTY